MENHHHRRHRHHCHRHHRHRHHRHNIVIDTIVIAIVNIVMAYPFQNESSLGVGPLAHDGLVLSLEPRVTRWHCIVHQLWCSCSLCLYMGSGKATVSPRQVQLWLSASDRRCSSGYSGKPGHVKQHNKWPYKKFSSQPLRKRPVYFWRRSHG